MSKLPVFKLVDKKTECLVFGYLRETQKHEFPAVIGEVCSVFYFIDHNEELKALNDKRVSSITIICVFSINANFNNEYT